MFTSTPNVASNEGSAFESLQDSQESLWDDFQASPFTSSSDYVPRRASYVASHSTRSSVPPFSTDHSYKSSSPSTVLTPPVFTPQYRHFPRPSLRPMRSSMKNSKPDPASRPNTPSKLSWSSRRTREHGTRRVTFLFPDGHREPARPPRSITSSVSSAFEQLRKLILVTFGQKSHLTWTTSAGTRSRDMRPELGFHQWIVDEEDVISMHSVRGRSRRISGIGSQSFLDLGEPLRGAYYD